MIRRTAAAVLVPLFATLALLVVPAAAQAANTIFVVDSTLDTADSSTADNVCDIGGGVCTLRAAIEQMNALPAPADGDFYGIHFGVPQVPITAALPEITNTVVVDGCNNVPPVITLTPCATLEMQTLGFALEVSGNSAQVKGLAFAGNAVGASALLVSGDMITVHGNWFGMKPNGTSFPFTGSEALVVEGTYANIGGTQPVERNVFVGAGDALTLIGTDETSIMGNYFSTNSSGVSGVQGATTVSPVTRAIVLTGAVTKTYIGDDLSGGELASAACDGACNVIGATTAGIDTEAATGRLDLDIRGNHIGLDATGAAALAGSATGADGIAVGEAHEVRIGDGTAFGRNFISGAWDYGIREEGAGGMLTVSGNVIGLDATGTTRLSASTYGAMVSGSTMFPTVVRANRFAHASATDAALALNGTAARVSENTFGLGADGSAIPLHTAIYMTANAQSNDLGPLGANIICATTAAAIEIADGDGNSVGDSLIGVIDGSGTDCPGGNIHSGVRITGTATGNAVGLDATDRPMIANTTHDAVVVNGAGATGNTIVHVATSDIGGQIIDIGGGATGNGPGNPGGDAGGILAPSITVANTARVTGTAPVGSRIRTYETASTAGTQPSSLGALYANSVTSTPSFTSVISPPFRALGSRVALTTTAADGTTSELTNAAALADGSPPDTAGTGPTGSIGNTTPTFTLTSTEPGSTFTCLLQKNGATFSDGPCTSPVTFGPLEGASYRLAVTAWDPAGNADPSPKIFEFALDTMAPETTITARPAAKHRFPSTAVAFSSPEASANFRCSFDGAATAPCVSPVAIADLSQGEHTFVVAAVDPFGNVDASPQVVTFTVDTVGPQIKLGPGATKWTFLRKQLASPRLSCVDVHTPCTVTASIKSAKRVSVRGATARIVTFGTVKLMFADGKVAARKVRLSAAGTAALRALGSVKAQVTFVARDAYGNSRTTKAAVTLK